MGGNSNTDNKINLELITEEKALHTCMMFWAAAAAACRTGHLLTVSLASLLYRYNLGSASYHLYRGSSCRGGWWSGVTVLTTGSSRSWSWPGYTAGPTTHCTAFLLQQTSKLTETRSFSMKYYTGTILAWEVAITNKPSACIHRRYFQQQLYTCTEKWKWRIEKINHDSCKCGLLDNNHPITLVNDTRII